MNPMTPPQPSAYLRLSGNRSFSVGKPQNLLFQIWPPQPTATQALSADFCYSRCLETRAQRAPSPAHCYWESRGARRRSPRAILGSPSWAGGDGEEGVRSSLSVVT